MKNRHYSFGVVAQFFNIAAQVATWSFTILYAEEVWATRRGRRLLPAGQPDPVPHLAVRDVLAAGQVPTHPAAAGDGHIGVVLALIGVFSQNIVGLMAIVCISASLSLMFPTIYGVALHGLGDDTKFGAAGLVMAILGGALIPPVQGLVADATGSQAIGFLIVAFCLAVVAAYAFFDLKTNRNANVDGRSRPATDHAALTDRPRSPRAVAGVCGARVGQALTTLRCRIGASSVSSAASDSRSTSSMAATT